MHKILFIFSEFSLSFTLLYFSLTFIQMKFWGVKITILHCVILDCPRQKFTLLEKCGGIFGFQSKRWSQVKAWDVSIVALVWYPKNTVYGCHCLVVLCIILYSESWIFSHPWFLFWSLDISFNIFLREKIAQTEKNTLQLSVWDFTLVVGRVWVLCRPMLILGCPPKFCYFYSAFKRAIILPVSLKWQQ